MAQTYVKSGKNASYAFCISYGFSSSYKARFCSTFFLYKRAIAEDFLPFSYI